MPNKVVNEGKLSFTFCDVDEVYKFDETTFFLNEFNKLKNSKGVDFISIAKDTIQLIEVKDCLGHEADNLWRVGANNTTKNLAAKPGKVEDRDSFDLEVAQKVASTIACVYGSWSESVDNKGNTEEFNTLWENMASELIPSDKKKIRIVLFLDGEFELETRNKSAIMTGLQSSIKQQLSWLKCSVSVVDSGTCGRSRFSVSRTA